MMSKRKQITETEQISREQFQAGDNVLRNVKILNFTSKNKRYYPPELLRKSLGLYEGAPVNIDHPDDNSPRKYESRFGRVINVKLLNDGLYGDLVYNPEHKLAKSFAWWSKNDPNAIGLSHNCIAKTKYGKDGIETITEIDRIASVDLVADPGSTKGLFEHLITLENKMDKDDMKEDLVRKLDKGDEIKMEKDGDEMKDMEAMKTGMDMNEADDDEKTYENYGEYKEAMKSKMMEIVGDEDKVMKLMDLLSMHDEMNMEEAEDEEKKDKEDEKKDMEKMDEEIEDVKKAEESLRSSEKKGYRLLLEELDSYRVKEQKNLVVNKAKEACVKSGLPSFAITECFIDTLISANENQWTKLLEDRRKLVFAGNSKKPISTGPVSVDNKQSVSDLVKQLTSGV